MKKVLLLVLCVLPVNASSPKNTLSVPPLGRQYSREKLLEIREQVKANPVLVKSMKEQLSIDLSLLSKAAQVANHVSPNSQSGSK